MKAAITPRRTTHGSSAWTLPSRYETLLKQPQDGALANSVQSGKDLPGAARVRAIAAALRESSDDHLTGSMRSLARRVLGLNVTAPRKSEPISKPVENYFAEPHLLDALRKDSRKAPDGARPMKQPRPQVA